MELERRPDAPLLARQAVGRLTTASPATIERLKLLATELVTNSCLHVASNGAIELSLEIDAGVARVAVADSGNGFERPARAPGLDSESGRGLLIVDSLADRWGIETRPSTRVWAELDL